MLNELNGEADGRLYEVIILKTMQADGAVCSAHRSAWFSPVKPSSGAGTKLTEPHISSIVDSFI